MYQLGTQTACDYVRRILDELASVEDLGMLVSPDAVDLRRLVLGSMVEAAVKIHSNAPAILVDGIVGAAAEDYDAQMDADGVITITMLKDTVRIASVQAADSPIIVTELIPEDSAEGRKQLNRYVRGVSDDPRVVLAKRWKEEYKPMLRYYSTNSAACPDITLEYVPYPTISEGVMLISPRLEYAVLNEITAMVLESLSEHDKAGIYRTKAKEYMEGK